MSRRAVVALADAWDSNEIREQVLAGILRIKLPIRPADMPRTYAMRQVSHGRVPASGKDGLATIWLFHRTIVFMLGCGDHAHCWGVEFSTPTEALHVFATVSSHDDEVFEHMRGHALAFYGNQKVRVKNLDHTASVESQIHPMYRTARTLEAKGVILCRAIDRREDFWLVQHEGSVAAYHTYELELLSP